MFGKLKILSRDLVVYGMGDVAVQVVGFLLLPLFTSILKTADYGALNLLMLVELACKILFRFGVDGAFMRLYYDCRDERSRQRLASTIFLFLFAANGAVLVPALAFSGPLARSLFRVDGLGLPLALVLVNTFISGFFFIPFHLLRIEGRSLQFSALTFTRASATVVLRVLFIAVFRFGVLGFILADTVVAVVFAGVLFPWFARLIRPAFSRQVLREALRFGLPRVPHGLAQQVIGTGSDGFLLRLFLPAAGALGKIGQYSIGATFGLTLKLFLSAFEYAWAPFYFATMKESDAPVTFSRLTTYAFALLVLMTAGLSAIASDLIRMMTSNHSYFEGAVVVPWIAIGVTFQGVYLLTSIGLNITRHTEYYPVATGIAAGVNVGANLVLIPRVGILGPAYANAISYAVLALVSMYFSQRVYPIRYEWGRLARIVAAGVAGYVLAWLPLPSHMYAPLGLLARGSIVVVTFAGCLVVTRFFRPRELARMRALALQFGTLGGRQKAAPEEPAGLGR